jgi:hypothetical protein
MDYNWEEIFKDKTDKELYKICVGDSFLPASSIPFARKELERRNFDFKNLSIYAEGWKAMEIEEEIAVLKQQSKEDHKLTPKQYLFTVIGTALVGFLSFYRSSDPWVFALYLAGCIVIVSILFITSNYFYSLKVKKIHSLIEKKEAILKDISDKGFVKEKQHILEEIRSQNEKNARESRQVYIWIGIVFTILYLIAQLFKLLD